MTGKSVFRDDGILDLAPAGKSELLKILATAAAERTGLPGEEILSALVAREALGTTALGRGIALPHARLDGIADPLALLARLRRPIEFDARDGEPVDLVFLVLWPTLHPDGFLPALSDICRVLREPRTPRELRHAGSPAEAMEILRQAGLVGPSLGGPGLVGPGPA